MMRKGRFRTEPARQVGLKREENKSIEIVIKTSDNLRYVVNFCLNIISQGSLDRTNLFKQFMIYDSL